MDPEALEALPVGLFRVDDRGVVQWAGEQALRWPDLTAETPEALVGADFFEDVAPAAASALFRGRFREGVEAGQMDETFVYTYVGAQSSATNLRVQLYSPSDQSDHWIVFQILEPA
jgi:photoactive yellow protein